ncbi:uncharacterized protein K489DRAFT_376819 [Dissoconium aciculare CBS 342.82]|uniref:Uncharacterized protein n=1 Tax=Dissoconium aciculare CBS 342.82 TaxID=1314786 RepID=A0A6J3MEW8_9PEZI|nr:uncharacterized protein K489DRAFT_376819 [Dissoconium aciculare CBS 342.82]KAF1826408.1 hypothetical protein K489DRAFT_376819 [Dissoconium aciculare CBS 342.82]
MTCSFSKCNDGQNMAVVFTMGLQITSNTRHRRSMRPPPVSRHTRHGGYAAPPRRLLTHIL